MHFLMVKLVSWNVNGIRAVLRNNFVKDIEAINPDILCIQETKAHVDQVDKILADFPYHYWNSAEKKGYAGTAVFSKIKPLSTTYGLDNKPTDENDKEGRILTVEFKDYYIVTVYVPNSKRGLLRLTYRQQWDKDFLVFLKSLEQKKPVIVCGDFNVAHTALDLANPKSNYNKTAGYTQIEIDGFTNLINAGFIDTFREFNKEPEQYTWWSYMFNARAKNIGWRIDYFLISPSLKSKLKQAFILQQIKGSDHCPVGIELK